MQPMVDHNVIMCYICYRIWLGCFAVATIKQRGNFYKSLFCAYGSRGVGSRMVSSGQRSCGWGWKLSVHISKHRSQAEREHWKRHKAFEISKTQGHTSSSKVIHSKS